MDVSAIAEKFTEHASAVRSVLETAERKSAERAAEAERKSAERASELETQVGAIRQDLLSTRQQMIARGSGGTPIANKSWGAQFVSDPEVKTFGKEVHRSRVEVEIKTVSNASTSGGPLWQPQRDGVTMLPMQSLPLRSLIPTVAVSDAGSVEYATQTGPRTLAANMVAELSAKPETNLAWTLKTVKMEVLAVWIAASRQALDDGGAQLQSLIDNELTYEVRLKEEAEILFGTGVSPHLTGIIPAAATYSAPIVITSPTLLDTIALAALQLGLAGFPATGVCLHPSDWARAALVKDSTGMYVASNPQAAMTPMLWGIPVSICQTLAPDQFLIGNFAAGATLYDRMTLRIETAKEHADFFTSNKIAILAEERLGLAVRNGAAFVTGDLGNVP